MCRVIGSGSNGSGPWVWVVATGVVIGQCEGQFRSPSIYADVSCVGFIGSGSDVWVHLHSRRCPCLSGGVKSVAAACGCARTPVAVHVCIWGYVESGSNVWVRSHSRRCPRLSGGVESVAAMCGCARTPVAVHICIWGVVESGNDMWMRLRSRRCPRLDLGVMSPWQQCVGALALPSLSTLGSGDDESTAETCGCARTPVAVHAWIWG